MSWKSVEIAKPISLRPLHHLRVLVELRKLHLGSRSSNWAVTLQLVSQSTSTARNNDTNLEPREVCSTTQQVSGLCIKSEANTSWCKNLQPDDGTDHLASLPHTTDPRAASPLHTSNIPAVTTCSGGLKLPGRPRRQWGLVWRGSCSKVYKQPQKQQWEKQRGAVIGVWSGPLQSVSLYTMNWLWAQHCSPCLKKHQVVNSVKVLPVALLHLINIFEISKSAKE